jgi:hypothetical protein
MSNLPAANEPSEPPRSDERPMDVISPFSRVQKRRDKIVAQIEANRRGEYKVPTWVLVVILLAFIGGWVAVIVIG